MKIGPLNTDALQVAKAAGKTERVTQPAPGADVGAVTSGVPVSVSSAVRSLDAASSVGSGIDEAKVASIKAAIAAGTFKVDAGNVADKMLSNAQEILDRTGGR